MHNNITDSLGVKKTIISSERIFIAILDGKYANQIDILAFDDEFIMGDGIEVKTKNEINLNFTNKSAVLYRFRNWDPYTKS